jgi:CDP-diacylglycerol--glycerol-3-phosphate 3-phosphatidyltransferase
MFCLIAWEHYRTSLALFVIATGTDWLDGYFARKYQQVTTLGRILDPFVDKVIVCGTFIFVIAVPQMTQSYLGLRPWMVVVIVGRELLITALRSFVEDRGSDFSAKMAGKLKMVFQCVAAGACLLYLQYLNRAQPMPGWAWTVMVVSLWGSIVLTIYSGVDYIRAAVRLMRSSR